MIPRPLATLLALALSATLPAAAEQPAPVPAARPCPAFGPGFVRVEGSDACVRVRGRVAVEGGGAVRPGGLARGAEAPRPVLGASGRLDIDARTETDYGPARSFVRIGGGRRFPQ